MDCEKTCSLCGINIFRKDCITLQKLHYETPVVELLQFEAEDIIRTSGSNSGFIGDGDFVGTAPDFGWGEWPSNPDWPDWP